MTEVIIKNCNNISRGKIIIDEQRLNIKYAINGTGKSTIAKAIMAKAQKNNIALDNLRPYNIDASDTENQPKVEGTDGYEKVMMFDENYVNNFVFQTNDLIKNSFNIFVKPAEYDEQMKEIESLLQDVKNVFKDHEELNELITAMGNFVDSFGSNGNLAHNSSLYRGLGKGNKISNVPKGLEEYGEFLQLTEGGKNAKWLKWQLGGKDYLSVGDKCPYCTSNIVTKKDVITKLADTYDVKYVEHINKLLNIFDELKPYFTEGTVESIRKFENNEEIIDEDTEKYLLRLKEEISHFHKILENLQKINYDTFKELDTKVSSKLKKYRIDLQRFPNLNSKNTQKKVEAINSSLNTLLEKAGELQGSINKQNLKLRKTIEENRSNINCVLQCGGYKYEVDVVEKMSII